MNTRTPFHIVHSLLLTKKEMVIIVNLAKSWGLEDKANANANANKPQADIARKLRHRDLKWQGSTYDFPILVCLFDFLVPVLLACNDMDIATPNATMSSSSACSAAVLAEKQHA
jgi:hypothetical protein